MNLPKINLILKGGRGSGNFGHTGRPGKRGGSGGGKGIRSLFSNSKVTDDIRNLDDDKNADKLEGRISEFPSDIELTDPDVVSNVSKNSGVKEEIVEKYISSWNGGSVSGRFVIAEAVRQELGVDLSPYEKKNRSKWLEEAKSAGNFTPELMSDYKKISKAIYDDTQKQLKELGSSEIMLYRGIAGEETTKVKEGEIAKLHGNSADSWTTGQSVARGFAQKVPGEVDFFAEFEEFPGGMVIKSSIPAERIFSMPSSGAGTSEEREMIVLGNGPNDDVLITEKFEPERREFF